MTTLRVAQQQTEETVPQALEPSMDIATTRDYSKLRKAAASQSTSKLREEILLGGWTARDIDDNDAYNQTKGKQKQRQHASKSALHMAAWKGCLDNVKYLIEEIGCDVDAYSKQEFSYGKTAIFFALTQSRPDITEYLLNKGAKVTIVNNKGQSVLSMAATHFEDSNAGNRIIEKIKELEEQQGDWWNFRASHSDGFEYGDLDPRFFVDRPLKDTDVVSELAINPTNKQNRKGGFLRRNPEANKWKNSCRGDEKQNKQQNRKKKSLPTLSQEEQSQLDRAWKNLLSPLALPSEEALEQQSMLEILRLSDKQRSSWIPQAAIRLNEGFGTKLSVELIEKVMDYVRTQPEALAKRQIHLLEKLRGRIQGGNKEQHRSRQHQQGNDSNVGKSVSNNAFQGSNPCFNTSDQWKMARQEVRGLGISCIEGANSLILTLPNRPIFVDTPSILRDVSDKVSQSGLVAIDTEWYTPLDHISAKVDDNKARPRISLSTLQIAFWDRAEERLSAYVINLICENSEPRQTQYNQLAKNLIQNLLDACIDGKHQKLPLVLGFAISHDLSMLESYANKGGCEMFTDSENKAGPKARDSSCYTRVLDLQSVFSKQQQHTSKTKSQSYLPGLKACAARYSPIPLSKECQCSDWGQRPLSNAQLDYAGLDAAILLVLLSELSKTAICKLVQDCTSSNQK